MSAALRTAAAEFIAARRADQEYAAGYELACKRVPTPRSSDAATLDAYSAARVEAARAAGYSIAESNRLHAEALRARASMIRAGRAALRVAGLATASVWSQADALVAACTEAA